MYKTDRIGEISRMEFYAPICNGCVDFDPVVSKLVGDKEGVIDVSISCANKELCWRKLERLNEMERKRVNESKKFYSRDDRDTST